MDTRLQPQDVNQEESFGFHDQYFTFMLAEEEYGIDILNVVEIRGLEKLTAIPSAPVFVKGVLNLRGSIIPVMDLRERFNMPTIPYGRATVVVVLQVTDKDDEKKEIGIIVDAVSDVYRVNQNHIKPKPDVCNQAGHDYIAGIASIPQDNKPDKLVIVLDVNKLMDYETIDKFEEIQVNHEKN